MKHNTQELIDSAKLPLIIKLWKCQERNTELIESLEECEALLDLAALRAEDKPLTQDLISTMRLAAVSARIDIRKAKGE